MNWKVFFWSFLFMAGAVAAVSLFALLVVWVTDRFGERAGVILLMSSLVGVMAAIAGMVANDA